MCVMNCSVLYVSTSNEHYITVTRTYIYRIHNLSDSKSFIYYNLNAIDI